MTEALVRGAIVAIFFVSGAAGLVYEVLWTRQLSLVFGVTTYAVATVLATFMGGLALGSYWFGRWIDRRSAPLAVYAALEASIGLYGFFVPALFAALRTPYVLLRQLDVPYPVMASGRALLAALVLIVPTTLMGGTFPILARYWVRSRGEVGRGTGLLYFVNTAGAIAGCLLGGFVLIEHLGLRGTTHAAVAANFLVATVAAVLASVSRARAPVHAGTSADEPAPLSPPTIRLVLLCIGLSGFTSLAYEVLWTRALLRYVYNSTYAFTVMLAVFLCGIAGGSAVYASLLRRSRHPLLIFAALQALVGIGFVGSGICFANLPQTVTAIIGSDAIHSFAGSLRLMVLNATLILLPPTLFLGAALPLATALCARGLTNLGRTVGRVYAVNTLGAILGSIGAGFVLIPTIGMQGTLSLMVSINLVSAGALAITAAPTAARRVAVAVVAAVVIVSALLVLPGDVFRRTFAAPGQQLAFYREGATDTVGVVDTYGQRVIVYEDRRGTAATSSYSWNFFLGHLPMLLHPGEPKRVLHICFGVGNSLSAVTAHDSVERVDSVELSPHVVEAAPFFWSNDDVITNPKIHTIIDDGRNFLMANRETYDVIVLEPPETFTAGVINLYTTEFYRDALSRLNPDGIMMQWIPTGNGPLDLERMLFRSFSDVFPHVTAWRLLDGGCVLLIGTKEPLTIDYQRLAAKIQRPHIRRDFDLMHVRNVDHLLSFFIFDEPAIAEFVRDAPPVVDDHTVLDFAMPRYIGSGFGLGQFNLKVQKDGQSTFGTVAERMRYYTAQRRSVVPYLTNLGSDSPQTVAARIDAEAAAGTAPAKPIPEAEWRHW